jgi:hypothetical protein
MTTPAKTRKPASRKSPGRPPKPASEPRFERRSLSLLPAEWDRLDAVPGANRSDKLRYLLTLYDSRS